MKPATHIGMVAQMTSNIEAYLKHLDSLVGGKGTCSRITEEGERPPICVVSYRDVPEPGSITGFTYGLSSAEHPVNFYDVKRPCLGKRVL